MSITGAGLQAGPPDSALQGGTIGEDSELGVSSPGSEPHLPLSGARPALFARLLVSDGGQWMFPNFPFPFLALGKSLKAQSHESLQSYYKDQGATRIWGMVRKVRGLEPCHHPSPPGPPNPMKTTRRTSFSTSHIPAGLGHSVLLPRDRTGLEGSGERGSRPRGWAPCAAAGAREVLAVSELSGEAQTHGEPCRARPIQMLEISPPQ